MQKNHQPPKMYYEQRIFDRCVDPTVSISDRPPPVIQDRPPMTPAAGAKPPGTPVPLFVSETPTVTAATLGAEAARLRADNEELGSRCDAKDAQIDAMKSEIEALRGKVAEGDRRSDSLQTELETKQAGIDALRKQIGAMNQTATKFVEHQRVTIEGYRARAEAADATTRKLQEEATHEAPPDIAAVLGELNAAKDRVDVLTDEVAKLGREKKELAAKISSQTEDNERLSKKLRELDAGRRDLEKNFTAQLRAAADARDSVSSKLVAVIQRLANMTAELRDAKDTISGLRGRLATAEGRASEAAATLERSQQPAIPPSTSQSAQRIAEASFEYLATEGTFVAFDSTANPANLMKFMTGGIKTGGTLDAVIEYVRGDGRWTMVQNGKRLQGSTVITVDHPWMVAAVDGYFKWVTGIPPFATAHTVLPLGAGHIVALDHTTLRVAERVDERTAGTISHRVGRQIASYDLAGLPRLTLYVVYVGKDPILHAKIGTDIPTIIATPDQLGPFLYPSPPTPLPVRSAEEPIGPPSAEATPVRLRPYSVGRSIDAVNILAAMTNGNLHNIDILSIGGEHPDLLRTLSEIRERNMTSLNMDPRDTVVVSAGSSGSPVITRFGTDRLEYVHRVTGWESVGERRLWWSILGVTGPVILPADALRPNGTYAPRPYPFGGRGVLVLDRDEIRTYELTAHAADGAINLKVAGIRTYRLIPTHGIRVLAAVGSVVELTPTVTLHGYVYWVALQFTRMGKQYTFNPSTDEILTGILTVYDMIAK